MSCASCPAQSPGFIRRTTDLSPSWLGVPPLAAKSAAPLRTRPGPARATAEHVASAMKLAGRCAAYPKARWDTAPTVFKTVAAPRLEDPKPILQRVARIGPADRKSATCGEERTWRMRVTSGLITSVNL